MIKKICIVAVLGSFVFGASLSTIVEKSLNNKLIESSLNSIDATKLDYDSLKMAYMPSLTFGASYTNTSHESPSLANSSIDSSLSIKYNLYDGNKKNNSFDALKSNIKSKNLNLENQKNKIALDVITQYFNYISLLEQKKAKKKEIKQLDTQYKNKKKFFETGTIAIDELEKILSRLENTNVSLQEIELNMQTILHFLEYTTGEKIDIQIGSKIKNIKDNKSKLRADIEALEFELKSLKSDAKAQKSSLFPQVNIDNSYKYSDASFNNKGYDLNPDTQNVLSLNLSWKLYDFNSTNKAYEANMKRYLALKSQYEYEKNKVNVDLKLAYRAYEIAKIKIKSAKAGLKSATSTYNAIEAKYENSLVDNVAFLEALSEKYTALSILKSAEYDLEIKRANIVYFSGYDLIDFIN